MNHCKENKPYNQVEKEEHEVYRKHLSPLKNELGYNSYLSKANLLLLPHVI